MADENLGLEGHLAVSLVTTLLLQLILKGVLPRQEAIDNLEATLVSLEASHPDPLRNSLRSTLERAASRLSASASDLGRGR